jgi:HK97 family phage major capsid protein
MSSSVVIAAAPAAVLPRVVFLMKDSTVQLIRKLKDSTNQYLWQPGMQAGAPNMLYGFPVFTSQDMPAATTGLKSVVFGQLSSYKVREVGAIRLRRFDELYGETDQTGFIAFHEADGGLLDAGGNPVKHLIQA